MLTLLQPHLVNARNWYSSCRSRNQSNGVHWKCVEFFSVDRFNTLMPIRSFHFKPFQSCYLSSYHIPNPIITHIKCVNKSNISTSKIRMQWKIFHSFQQLLTIPSLGLSIHPIVSNLIHYHDSSSPRCYSSSRTKKKTMDKEKKKDQRPSKKKSQHVQKNPSYSLSDDFSSSIPSKSTVKTEYKQNDTVPIHIKRFRSRSKAWIRKRHQIRLVTSGHLPLSSRPNISESHALNDPKAVLYQDIGKIEQLGGINQEMNVVEGDGRSSLVSPNIKKSPLSNPTLQSIYSPSKPLYALPCAPVPFLDPSRTFNPKFGRLNLMGPLLQSINDLGWKIPTPIQERMIPLAIRGLNIVSSAETGTGKTASYAMPLLHRLHILKKGEERENTPSRQKAPLALVLCPTRELCEQVEEEIYRYAKYMQNIRIIALSGSSSAIKVQIRELKKGVDILVATPGRLFTLINPNQKIENNISSHLDDDLMDDFESEIERKNEKKWPSQVIIDLGQVKFLVLDEVDRMLSMGLFPQVYHIFKALPRPQKRRDPSRMQVFMLTATLVPRVDELVKRFSPYHIRIDLNQGMQTAQNISQAFYQVSKKRKYSLLAYLLRRKGSMKEGQVLVFCRTKQRVQRVSQQLEAEGFSAHGIHGDQRTMVRQKKIDDFKDGKCRILVSTDVMARGMDIPKLPFVINYDLPHDPEQYIHRIGRTARAGESGKAISFVSQQPTLLEVGNQLVEMDELDFMKAISKLIKHRLNFSKVPGPWRDEDKVSVDSEYKNERNRKVREKKGSQDGENKTLEKRAESLVEHWQGEAEKKTGNMAQKRFEKRSKSGERIRDFEKGRYEDVLFKFDVKKARKMGIHVPDHLDAVIAEKRKKILKKKIKKALQVHRPSRK